jgi:DinB superfamily
MHYLEVAKELAYNKDVFRHLFPGLASEQFLWKPAPDKWCLLEILCHLLDEEREDSKARVTSVLRDPAQPLSPINPVGWVTSRNYIAQNFEAVLHDFLAERDASVTILRALNDPQWENTHLHPKSGPMPASLFLHNWLAHDYLHFRQVTAIKYQFLKAHSTDPLNYAGDW